VSPAIYEADWKLLRQLHPVALERFTQRVLAEIERIASDVDKSCHERYLAIYEIIKLRDRELAEAFDDLRRSTAIVKLAYILSHDLLTEEELGRFSPDTREAIGSSARMGR